MATFITTRLQASHATATTKSCRRRYVVAATASGRQAATGGEGAAGVSECNRRTAIGVGVVAATFAPLPQSTAYGAVDSVATLKSAYAAFGEFDATKDDSKLLSLVADNVIWSTNFNGGYETKNIAGVKRFFKWVDDHITTTNEAPIRFVSQGNTVVCLLQWSGVSKTTGKPFTAELVHFVEVDPNTGKIVSLKELADTKAMDVFGVPWYQG